MVLVLRHRRTHSQFCCVHLFLCLLSVCPCHPQSWSSWKHLHSERFLVWMWFWSLLFHCFMFYLCSTYVLFLKFDRRSVWTKKSFLSLRTNHRTLCVSFSPHIWLWFIVRSCCKQARGCNQHQVCLNAHRPPLCYKSRVTVWSSRAET